MIFNNDSTIASAVLDRLLHQADPILIEAPSYRMKVQAGEQSGAASNSDPPEPWPFSLTPGTN